jgi:hypothetical protein
MAKVYKQTPNHISDIGVPAIIRQGDFVDIYVGQNPADSVMDANRNDWKKNLFNPDQLDKPKGNDTSKK